MKGFYTLEAVHANTDGVGYANDVEFSEVKTDH